MECMDHNVKHKSIEVMEDEEAKDKTRKADVGGFDNLKFKGIGKDVSLVYF